MNFEFAIAIFMGLVIIDYLKTIAKLLTTLIEEMREARKELAEWSCGDEDDDPDDDPDDEPIPEDPPQDVVGLHVVQSKDEKKAA